MVFSSNIFLFLFLPFALVFYFLPLNLPSNFGANNSLKKIAAKYKNYVLLIFSLIFYSWGEACYVWLLGLSILANYFFGLLIEKKLHQKNGQKNNHKKIVLFCALFFNLALLLYFKYAVFLAQNLEILANYLFPQYGFEVAKSMLPARLPIGISFFTFHAISYLVDIYRAKCKAQKSLTALALYIAFFPQLIAGPIVRYNAIAKYLGARKHGVVSASHGIRRFIIGFAKKIIIANPLGEVADAIFSTPVSSLNPAIAWLGAFCYTMQIYFDFSGYCDMAIGLARVFGFKFPENFNYPYVAKSIKEFWRRWHMSLSAWFRDYVYIPLGGNKVSVARQYFNLVTVFFLCGLWHGASWNFIVWGLFHGFFLVFERIKIGSTIINFMPNFLQHFYTILVVIIGWIFFRSNSLEYALNYLKLMFFGFKNNFENVVISNKILQLANSHFFLSVAAVSLIGFSPLVNNFTKKIINKNKFYLVAFDVFLIAVFVFAIIRLSASTHNPFIYFQF